MDTKCALQCPVVMFRAWLEGLGKDWVEHGSIERFIVDKKQQKGSTAAVTTTTSTSAGGEEDASEAASTCAASPRPSTSPVVAYTIGSPISSSGSPLVYMNPPLRPGQVTTGDAAKLRSELVDTFLAAREQTEISTKGDGEGIAATASGSKQSSPVTSSPTTSGNPSSSKAATRRFIPAIGTDGPWDMRKFMHECSVLRDGHVFPELFYSWVDVRRNFSDFHKKRLMKLTHMLRFLGLSFIGERHRGIDDARNIARVAMSLVRKGYKFRQVCQIPYLAEGSADLAQQRILSDLLQDEIKRGGGGMGSKKQSSEGNKKKKGGGKNSNNNNSQKGKNKKKK